VKNIFGIFQCLVGVKIMVNGNYFQFDHKIYFNFLETIYSFENRKSFSGFKLFILACMFVGRHQRCNNPLFTKKKNVNENFRFLYMPL
jgi:hypothetical protein